MIKINARSEVPQSLSSEKVTEAKKYLKEKHDSGKPIKSRDFDGTIWRHPDVKDSLLNSQHKKCCYCENKRAPRREFDVEHFRPKGGVLGEDMHPGYWWLAYEWSNMLYACKPCNEDYKRHQFPVNGTRAQGPDDDTTIESARLVDPIEENPEDYIGFDWQRGDWKFVIATGLHPRGTETIDITCLNRAELQEERAEQLDGLKNTAEEMVAARKYHNEELIKALAEIIREKTSSNNRFAAFRRVFFRSFGLGEYVSST